MKKALVIAFCLFCFGQSFAAEHLVSRTLAPSAKLVYRGAKKAPGASYKAAKAVSKAAWATAKFVF